MADTPTLYVATRKGIFTVARSAGRWAIKDVAFRGENVTMLLPLRDGTVYAAVGHGHFGCKMHKSSDAGKTWQPIASPAYPTPAAGEPPLVDEMGRTIPNALQMIWSLEQDASGTLWCGTVPGGLFTSGDKGQSWGLNRPLWEMPDRLKWMGGGADYPGIHSICFDPRNPRRVFAAVSSGGVWLSDDAGKTWRAQCQGMRAAYVPPDQIYNPVYQDPHRVVVCPSRPDVMWCQHHNGIFRTADAAATWEEITEAKPSAFGFAVVVHPRDSQTAWFVPAVKDEERIPAAGKVVVSRTRDGGKSFDVLAKGLPQEHAYDITYRHAMDIDATGNTLAFGSTTGSLWVSENQGDSWQTVGEHLPPIYCTRFEV